MIWTVNIFFEGICISRPEFNKTDSSSVWNQGQTSNSKILQVLALTKLLLLFVC